MRQIRAQTPLFELAMTASGLTNSVQYDVATTIEMAARWCGKLAGSLSAEDTILAQQSLQTIINTLVNEGTPLWTISKQIYGLNLNQNLLPLSADTIDIQNALYRFNNMPSGGIASSSSGNAANAFDQNLATACTQSAPNGNIAYNFTTPVAIVSVGILMNATATLAPTYEYSADGITWSTAISAPIASSYTQGQWYYLDVASPQNAQYFRVRETSGGTLNLTEVIFTTAAREIILSRINKDDYQNLPNKNQIGRPLQYWFDRQIIPQMWLWTASMYSFNSVVVWSRHMIQDIGSFQNTLNFPNRWMDVIIYELAFRMSMLLLGVDPQRVVMLKQLSADAKRLAWTEERDNSPSSITANISCYTRGGR